MSQEQLKWAIKKSRDLKSDRARILLHEIAYISDERGVLVGVTQEFYAQRLGWALSSVGNQMSILRDQGLLEISRIPVPGSRGSVSRYELVMHGDLIRVEDTYWHDKHHATGPLSPEATFSDEQLKAALGRCVKAGWNSDYAKQTAAIIAGAIPAKMRPVLAKRWAVGEGGDSSEELLIEAASVAWHVIRTNINGVLTARTAWGYIIRKIESELSREGLAARALRDSLGHDATAIANLTSATQYGDASQLVIGFDELLQSDTLVGLIFNLIDAGMDRHVAWLGTRRVVELAATVRETYQHTEAAKDPFLADIGINPKAARAWMSLVIGTRRQTALNAWQAEDQTNNVIKLCEFMAA